MEYRDISHRNGWNFGLKLDTVKSLHFSDDPSVAYPLLVEVLLRLLDETCPRIYAKLSYKDPDYMTPKLKFLQKRK